MRCSILSPSRSASGPATMASMMTRRLAGVGVMVVLAFGASIGLSAAREQTGPLRVFLRGGPKTHGPATNGLRDGEVWVREWVPLLQSRGATAEGAIRFPTA